MTNKSFALSIQNLYYDETPFLSIACRLVVVDVGNTFGYGTYVQCTFHTVLYKKYSLAQLLTENLENGLDKGGVKANITTEYLNADYWSFRFRVLHHAPHLRACQATENGLDCDLQR